MKVTIEMSEEQAYVIMESLELLSRIRMGQLNEVVETIIRGNWEKYKEIDRTLVRFIVEALKRTIFKDLDQNAFYSIHSKEVGKDAHIAWDIYQTIRHATSWAREPNGGMTVNFDKPFHISQLQLPKITIED